MRPSLGGDNCVITAGLTDKSTEFVRDVFNRRLSVGNTGDQGEVDRLGGGIGIAVCTAACGAGQQHQGGERRSEKLLHVGGSFQSGGFLINGGKADAFRRRGHFLRKRRVVQAYGQNFAGVLFQAKLQRLTEKNAFFAEQEAKIQEKTDRVSVLLRCAAAEDPEPGFLRAVVTRANILVTYIRQLGQLLQEAKGTDRLPAKELTAALESSAQAATAAGLRCRVYNVAQGSFPAGMILSLYDLHERILEDVLTAGLGTLEVRLRNEQSGLRLVLSIPETTLQVFSARANHVVAAARALGGEARITEEDGTVSVFLEFLGG